MRLTFSLPVTHIDPESLSSNERGDGHTSQTESCAHNDCCTNPNYAQNQLSEPPRLISSLEAERDLFVRNNRRANEEVQFRKFFVHIGVASFE
jgi:hypothetical protein